MSEANRCGRFFILFTLLCLNSIINGVIKHFRGIM